MRYYLLIFLLSLNAFSQDYGHILDGKIKVIAQNKTFKEQKESVQLLQSEITKIKTHSKLSDRDFYILTDFSKTLDSISLIKDRSADSCFNTKVEIMSNFGNRSTSMSEKDLPDGVKKGLLLLKLLCSKKK
ncbi:hypothetical protein [Halobacteriovorax sp. JY17]|uniref:hypothetical protein n=1 Tax=Halobacteriovorax sp. JY17 TaxID=2014617 RepID=UPI000C4F6C62|nr:hypothetical protein [Halobacteriovorax sp. JY17]PIK15324.1 MAG: hypothetical protein CES88_01015 [Halobacteriovorax sp. JY17]